MRGLSQTTTLQDRATGWAAASFAVSLVATLAASLWLFVGYLQLSLAFLAFGGRVGVLDGGVVLQCGVFGFFIWSLLKRASQGHFAWPRPRRLLGSVLLAYARGWGVGVAVLTARQLALAIQGVLVPAIASPIDVVYLLIVMLVFSLPGLIAVGLGSLLSR